MQGLKYQMHGPSVDEANCFVSDRPKLLGGRRGQLAHTSAPPGVLSIDELEAECRLQEYKKHRTA